MVGDRPTTPASTRPRYGLDVPEGPAAPGNPYKKAALLALLALASGLLVLVPERDEAYELEVSADQGEADTDLAGPTAGPGSEAGTAPPTSVRKVAGDTGRPSDADIARLAPATEAALAGAEYGEASGAALAAYAEQMRAARSAIESYAAQMSTTAPPPAAEAERAAETTTTGRPAQTTAAPTTATTEAPTTSADQAEGQEPAGSTAAEVDQTAAASDPAPTEDNPGTDPTEPDGTTPTEPSTETTQPPTTPPTTAAPTTAPPTTAAPTTEPGWVDTGNGVLVPKVLLAIRWCESRDDYGAANPSSSARGAYQFLTGSWAAYGHKDRYGVNQAHLASRSQQDEAALITWQRDGTRPWNASKSCWSKRI